MEKRKRGQYGKPKTRDPFFSLCAVINESARQTGISVGKAMGTCYNTGVSRMNNPENLTLGELKNICKAYNISHEELCGLVKIGV